MSKNSAWYHSCSALATMWTHSLTFLLGRPHAPSRSFGCPLAPPVEGPFLITCKITGSSCACVPWAPRQGSAALLWFLPQCPNTSLFYPPHHHQARARLTRISFPPLCVAPPPLPGAAAYFPAFSDPGLAGLLGFAPYDHPVQAGPCRWMLATFWRLLLPWDGHCQGVST